jgi:hypothetical protein
MTSCFSLVGGYHVSEEDMTSFSGLNEPRWESGRLYKGTLKGVAKVTSDQSETSMRKGRLRPKRTNGNRRP